MSQFNKILRSIFTSPLSTDIPPSTYKQKVLCPATNKKISITFTLQVIPYENFTLYYYLCSNVTCPSKSKCTYLSNKEYYLCHLCNTLNNGTPAYHLHPISRICHKCNKKLTRTIKPNYRRQPLER